MVECTNVMSALRLHAVAGSVLHELYRGLWAAVGALSDRYPATRGKRDRGKLDTQCLAEHHGGENTDPPACPTSRPRELARMTWSGPARPPTAYHIGMLVRVSPAVTRSQYSHESAHPHFRNSGRPSFRSPRLARPRPSLRYAIHHPSPFRVEGELRRKSANRECV